MSLNFTETELLASAAQGATGEGDEIRVLTKTSFSPPPNTGAKVYLDVSAASGTSPTLDVTITKTIGGVDFILATFTQKTAAGQEVLDIANCPNLVKVKFTITGTGPSFTFQVQLSR